MPKTNSLTPNIVTDASAHSWLCRTTLLSFANIRRFTYPKGKKEQDLHADRKFTEEEQDKAISKYKMKNKGYELRST